MGRGFQICSYFHPLQPGHVSKIDYGNDRSNCNWQKQLHITINHKIHYVLTGRQSVQATLLHMINCCS